MSTQPAGRTAGTDDTGFTSKLSAPRERFLAAVVEHALFVGRRSAKDFIRHFPPRDIMLALKDQPRLRAKLLVSTTGIHEKVALKKLPASGAEDLEIALAEQVAVEEDIVALLNPDDRVRYLDHGKLWAFLVEGSFWRITADAIPISVAREHIAFIISRARIEQLLSPSQIVDGVGLNVLVESLPKDELGKIIEKAVSEGRAGRPMKDETVAELLPAPLLVEHVSLAHLWERLIADKLAFGKGTASTSLAPAPVPSASPSSGSLPAVKSPPPPEVSGASVPIDVAKLDAQQNGDDKIVIAEEDGDTLNSEVDAMLASVGKDKAQEKKEKKNGHSKPPPA